MLGGILVGFVCRQSQVLVDEARNGDKRLMAVLFEELPLQNAGLSEAVIRVQIRAEREVVVSPARMSTSIH